MNRVLAAFVAALVGAAAHVVAMWSPVLGSPSSEGVINTFVYTLVLAPAGFVALGLMLFGLDRVAPTEPFARWAIVGLVVALFPFFFVQLTGSTSESGWGPSIMGATGPYLLGAVLFLMLTRRTSAVAAQAAQ